MKKQIDIVPSFKVLFYKDENGNIPVNEFLDSLGKRERAKMAAMIGYLQDKGFNAVRPYVDTLRDGIHELRTKITGNQIRTLYFFCYREYIVLTHSFIKNSDEVPEEEINKAIKYRKDFLKRFNLPDKFSNA